ncbi:EAL domain-containing protein [Devosia rhizoryzae]|uniref:EAL domain-containing protein n=2 Tax=Devosia rhizoryzae TaxID=2774137 RepID=A0ABX7CA62_9HYPH|nr:EAL domain-containing protein [Devosia rhizoryzae]
MRHAKRATGKMKVVWNVVSALSVGIGIWATHFVAVLAFQPGFHFGFDMGLTTLSLAISVLLCGGGIAMAVHGTNRFDRILGGATIGVGISVMHYTGMAALLLEGEIAWQSGAVTVSILAGIVLASAAVVVGFDGNARRSLAGAGLLTAAICAMHFTAMAAADFSACTALAGASEMNSGLLSLVIALTSLMVLAAAFGSLLLDEVDRRHTMREAVRQAADAQRLAEVNDRLSLALTHMGQGLALFDSEGTLLLHNTRLLELLDLPKSTNAVGERLDALLCRSLEARGMDAVAAKAKAEEIAASYALMSEQVGGDIVQQLSDGRAYRVRSNKAGRGAWIATVEDISASRRDAAAIAHMAHHDSLTGLPNRARYNQVLDGALEAALASGDKLAVVALDLDRFKDINDSFGHAAGDQVLRALADQINGGLKDGEMVARLGGDEFAAVKPFTTMAALRDFLDRLDQAVNGRVRYGESMLMVGGSIGVAIYPDDGRDRSKLLNNADLALYRAKAELDQRICYYEQEMDEAARERRAVAKDLWTAIETEGFHLAYQVQKSVTTGRTTGYEVLLRWNRPGHGPMSPADFIPIAEECGAIGAIGAWVLSAACREAAAWPEPHKIAVNVSGLQLAQFELVDMVKHVLDQTGLAPHRLELEVTETAIIADRKRALAVLSNIKALGVSIAIDDFGTGYSSLDTLRSFPFDKIKLDRSFMPEVEHDEQAKAIIRAILALGKSLSVPVLAEGVETSAQLDVLRAEGCTEAQGFLLGRPGVIDWDGMRRSA